MIEVLQQVIMFGGYLPWTAEINVELPREMSRSDAADHVSSVLASENLPQRAEALALTLDRVERGWSPPVVAYTATIGRFARVLLRAETLDAVRAEDRRPAPKHEVGL
jgi:hypothetical protein